VEVARAAAGEEETAVVKVAATVVAVTEAAKVAAAMVAEGSMGRSTHPSQPPALPVPAKAR